MNQVIENNISKGNSLGGVSKNNNLKNKIKQEFQALNKKKIIKVASIGIAGLTALNMTVPKSALIEKTLSSGLNTLLYGNSSIRFMGILPVPNITVFVLIVCVIGGLSLIITGNLDILLYYKRGNLIDMLSNKGK